MAAVCRGGLTDCISPITRPESPDLCNSAGAVKEPSAAPNGGDAAFIWVQGRLPIVSRTARAQAARLAGSVRTVGAAGLAAAGEDIELTCPGKSHPGVMLAGR
jgi:hypothetical protein